MAVTDRTGGTHRQPGRTTVIAPETVVRGDIRSAGGLHIDGEVRGDAEAATYVIVARGAKVGGSIHAREVFLSGEVVGDIWAIEVEIDETGVCHGTVEAVKVKREGSA